MQESRWKRANASLLDPALQLLALVAAGRHVLPHRTESVSQINIDEFFLFSHSPYQIRLFPLQVRPNFVRNRIEAYFPTCRPQDSLQCSQTGSISELKLGSPNAGGSKTIFI